MVTVSVFEWVCCQSHIGFCLAVVGCDSCSINNIVGLAPAGHWAVSWDSAVASLLVSRFSEDPCIMLADFLAHVREASVAQLDIVSI